MDQVSMNEVLEKLHISNATGNIYLKRKAPHPLDQYDYRHRDGRHLKYVMIEGYFVFVHRLVWMKCHGTVPGILTHLDGNSLNNAIDNLEGTDLPNPPKRMRRLSMTGYAYVSQDGFGEGRQRWRCRCAREARSPGGSQGKFRFFRLIEDAIDESRRAQGMDVPTTPHPAINLLDSLVRKLEDETLTYEDIQEIKETRDRIVDRSK